MNLAWNIFSFFLAIQLLSGGIAAKNRDSGSENPDDDLSNSPDIEIDDSLSPDPSEYLSANLLKNDYPSFSEDVGDVNDENLDIYSNNINPLLYKHDDFNKPAECDPADNSYICNCKRACFPNNPTAFDPCTCDTNTVITPLESPPLLASQPSIPSYSSNVVDENAWPICQPDSTNPYCACQKACVPGVPVSYDPCTCVSFDSTPQSGINDFGFENYAPQPNFYDSTSMVPQSQDYTNAYMYNTPHLDQNSCYRACLPYTVQQQNPCICDFNMKSYQPTAMYGPSMVPTGYDTPNMFNSLGQGRQGVTTGHQGPQPGQPQKQKPDGPFINSHISKVSRPIPSVGAYLGCYRDKKKPGRDLKMGVPVPKLTPDSCVNKCREKKKRFAAVQNGYLCFCGSRFGRYNRTKDENCGTPCTGDPSKFCGGHWLNAVYSTDGQLYSPRQFSFRTSDPKDEVEHDKNVRKQVKKPKHKAEKSKGTSRQLQPEDKDRQIMKDQKIKESEKPKVSKTQEQPKDTKTAPKRKHIHRETKIHLKSQKETSTRKTILETANSATDMAEMLALGKKKSRLNADKKMAGRKNTRGEIRSIDTGKPTPNFKLIYHGKE